MATDAKTAKVEIMRTTLGRARGLGAAKSGTAVWWAERLTSVALVPLTLWFVLAVFHLEGQPLDTVRHWASHPVNATLLLALVIVTFQHMAMGLQVVIEDYVHGEGAKMIAVLANRGVCALLALASVISVLKLAFAG